MNIQRRIQRTDQRERNLARFSLERFFLNCIILSMHRASHEANPQIPWINQDLYASWINNRGQSHPHGGLMPPHWFCVLSTPSSSWQYGSSATVLLEFPGIPNSGGWHGRLIQLVLNFFLRICTEPVRNNVHLCLTSSSSSTSAPLSLSDPWTLWSLGQRKIIDPLLFTWAGCDFRVCLLTSHRKWKPNKIIKYKYIYI